MATKTGKYSRKQDQFRLVMTIFLNLGITISQGIVGLLTGSLALLTDALHNLSDVFSLTISYVASRLYDKKPNMKQTYGFKRAEIIAAFVNALLLVVLAVFLIKEALARLLSPVPVEPLGMILLSTLSVIINGISALLIKRGADHSLNMKSSYIHLISDALTSASIVVGGLIIYYTGAYWIDSVLSLFVASYLIFVTIQIFSKSLEVIMQFAPSSPKVPELVEFITAQESILNVHHVHLWQLTENEIHFEAHIEFAKDLPLSETTRLLSKLQDSLIKKFSIHHVTFQPEFEALDQKSVIVNDITGP